MPPNPDPAEGGEASGTKSNSNAGGVDESLYSRQLYVMGHEAQVRRYRLQYTEIFHICRHDEKSLPKLDYIFIALLPLVATFCADEALQSVLFCCEVTDLVEAQVSRNGTLGARVRVRAHVHPCLICCDMV